MVEPTEDLDKICDTLDRLTLDALLLIEEEIQLKLNIENAMCGGETHLAKARYIIGQNKVSTVQLPTENSPEFTAPVKVYQAEDEKLIEAKSFDIHITKKDEDETIQDPIRWFGVLVPQNLTYAQNMFRQALQWVVKATNVQNQLKETINVIYELKDAKRKLIAK